MLQVTKPSTQKKPRQPQTGTQGITGSDAILPDIITGNENPPVTSYRNCVGCGFVYSWEEYEKRDQCGFCGRPLSAKSRKENRRRRDEGEDEQGLAKAEALRERLVRYDRESAARTRITDDDQA